MMHALGLVGLFTFIFGIWLIRTGKSVEKEISQGSAIGKVRLFNNWAPNYMLELWGPNNTRPLAYLCVVAGLALLAIFAMSII